MGFYSATGGGGGLTQEEHAWLESLGKYTPNMYDINPTKQLTCFITTAASASYKTSNRIPLLLCGYDALSLYKYTANNANAKFVWVYNDGSVSDEINFTATSYGIGWHDFKIPANAIGLKLYGPISAAPADSGYGSTDFALFTKDSTYNPFNQTP